LVFALAIGYWLLVIALVICYWSLLLGQLSRAAASVAANDRAACVARSHAEFTAKIGLALEECDESVYWLQISRRSDAYRRNLSRLYLPASSR
jgi:four helix bundle protein